MKAILDLRPGASDDALPEGLVGDDGVLERHLGAQSQRQKVLRRK